MTPKTLKRVKRVTYHTVMQLLLIGVGVLYFIPLLWMIATSLKTPAEYTAANTFFPAIPQWQNYPNAIKAIDFGRYLLNSIIVSGVATLGTVFSCSLVAYSFSRLRWPGRDVLFMVLLGTMMLPAQILQIPTYILYKNFNWLDTFLPLTVPFFFNAGAFNIFLLRQFYRGVPMELSEAAKIDGCSHFRTCFSIVMPLCRPIVAAIAVFAFMGSWNDFMNPLIYLTSSENFTLALGLREFQQQSGSQYHYMMVVSLISMLPTLILFFSFQKYFVGGMTLGGVKE